jgi:hypothetical protein
MPESNALKVLRGSPPDRSGGGRARGFIRLAAAVAAGVLAAGFAHLYSLLEANWLEYGMKAKPTFLPVPTLLFDRYAAVAYLLPLAVLVLGLVAARREKGGDLFLEVVVLAAWLLSALLVLACLLAWRLPYYIPVAFIR